ncbi:hypothetical protein P3S68_033690 [Capsicum galapagoense]
MDCVKLVLFFICQLAFSLSFPHLCPNNQAHALLQFKHMLTFNPNASDICVPSNPTTLSWNKSTDCCSWNGVYCDEMTGQVIELDLSCIGLQGKFHTNSSLFQLSNLKRLDLSFNDFSGSLISPKFGVHDYQTDRSVSGRHGLKCSSRPGPGSGRDSIWSDYLYGLRFELYNFELLLKNLTQLRVLDIYLVNISPTIPLNFSSYLTTLLLPRSQLRGILPERVFHLSNLESLDLSYSSLTGPIPSNEFKSNTLEAVVLDQYQLQGTIPNGQIDSTVCNLKRLIMLDLGSNHLNGTIPHCLASLFENFQAMKINGENSGTQEYVADKYSVSYANTFIVTTKGLDLEFPRVLTTEIIINLSRNRFEGHIPTIIGDLVGLRTLNLSNNGLEGVIPASLHQLSVLESLDLSSNKIDGEIPQQLASLTSYQGNDGLRGLPLSKDCGGDDGVPQPTTPVELDDDEEEEGDLISWQAVLMGFGCGLVIGLSIIYIMLSTHYRFSRMVVKFEHKIDSIMKRY